MDKQHHTPATGSPEEMGNSELASQEKGRWQEKKGNAASSLQGRAQVQAGEEDPWFHVKEGIEGVLQMQTQAGTEC